MPLFYLSCAWVAGIFLGSKFSLPLVLILSGLIPLPFLFIIKRRRLIVLASLCLLAFFGGAFYFPSSLPPDDESQLHFYNDETVAIKGIISTDPEVRDKTVHLRLSASEIKLDEEWHQVSGTALLFVPRYPTYSYGDVLSVSGKLETPPQLDDFDYQGYLAHQGIYSTMLYPKIEIEAREQGSKPLAWVYSLRSNFSQTLAEVLPEPQASLAQGIILGKRGTIPLPLKENFVGTGTAHLLAISGLHLSIVAGILLSLGIWLFGRRHYTYIWLALGAIWLYALITGMHAPVVRGAIMASIFLAAELVGRQRSAFTALAFAAAVMVGVDPQILRTAPFQMSFLAMTGLILVTPPLQTLGRRAMAATLSEKGAVTSIANIITDSFSVTLGAIIAVWPLIAYYFGIISFVAPLATLIALPALPAIIISGALAGIVGLISLPLASIIGWLAWLFLSYMVAVVNFFALTPLSSIKVSSVSPALIGGYYLALALAIGLISNRQKLANLIPQAKAWLKSGVTETPLSRLVVRWLLPPLVVVAILVSVAAATTPDNNLHVSFLDVGQGDAILIQTPSGQDILIDGGPSPQPVTLELGKKMSFWDRTIDLVILTHPHADHLGGLIAVLERYEVSQVLYPDLDSDSPLYDEWQHLIEEKDIKYTIAQAGQRIDLGAGVIIEVLNPQQPHLTDTQSDIDNNGVVVRLTMGDVSFLLTADIMWVAEFELITHSATLNSTVLKVAHHGSDTSTSADFLAAVNSQLAVISSADTASNEVIKRLEAELGSENIYLTYERGTVEFTTDGKRLWLETEK